MATLATIRFADDELARFQNMIGALGEAEARRGLARAVNRVTRTVEGRVIRAIVKQSSIPRAIVKRSIKTRLAPHKGDGPLQGVISAIGDDLSLKHFRARQFAFGVKARIWNKWERFPGTFIWAGTYRSGKAVANGHVWQRTNGSASLPIEMMRGPSVPDELIRDEAQRQFEETVRTMLPARAMHELSRLLNA